VFVYGWRLGAGVLSDLQDARRDWSGPWEPWEPQRLETGELGFDKTSLLLLSALHKEMQPRGDVGNR
jgi:hypothetical protein